MSEFKQFPYEIKDSTPHLLSDVEPPPYGSSGSTFATLNGEGPDEVLPDPHAAAQRAIQLLSERGRTIPPREVTLRELRQLLGLTQADLAARLGVQQAAVSRFERRGDVTVSNLRDYVSSLGGTLEVHARFPEAEYVITSEDEPRKASR